MYVVEWIMENRIVLFRPVGDQTIETLEDGVNRLQELLNVGISPVHVISDSRYVGRFPTNLKSISLVKSLTKHDNAGHAVSIGGNSMVKFISMMLAKSSGDDRLVYKNTFEDAMLLLQRLDLSLPQEIDYIDRPPDEEIAT